jgi:chromate reductase
MEITIMHAVLVLVGSFRRGSFNRQLARGLEKLAAGRLKFTFAPIEELPHYNDDLWSDPLQVVLDFKQAIVSSDAVLVVTPEYNRSIPGIVKNALDWGSRPVGQNAWSGKPAAVCGASRGAIGTAAAQSQLRSIIPAVGLSLMSQPEVYIAFKDGLVAEDGEITVESTRAFLAQFITAFSDWIDRLG